MTRRRYVYRTNEETGEVEAVEVGEEWRATNRDEGHRSDYEVYGNMQATDGTDISSRTKHRRYMKEKGLTTADDFKGTWEKAAQERADVIRTGGDHRDRRESLERAAYQLEKRRRR